MKSHFNAKTKVHNTLQELKEYAPELKNFTQYKRFLIYKIKLCIQEGIIDMEAALVTLV